MGEYDIWGRHHSHSGWRSPSWGHSGNRGATHHEHHYHCVDLTGPALLAELRALRQELHERWLASLTPKQRAAYFAKVQKEREAQEARARQQRRFERWGYAFMALLCALACWVFFFEKINVRAWLFG